MKQSFITAIITAAILIAFFFGYKYYKEKKELQEYMLDKEKGIVDKYWRSTDSMAKGTNYNIDSLKKVVFETIPEEDIELKIGTLMAAQDSIRLRYKHETTPAGIRRGNIMKPL